MNCEQAGLFMMKFFDGEYNELEYIEFEEHLKCCKKCALDFANMKKVLSAVETDALIEPPENFESDVMAKVSRIKRAKQQKSKKWIVILYKTAAVICVFLLATLMYGKNLLDVSNMIEQMDAYAVPLKSLIHVVLTIIMVLPDSVADTLQILNQVATAIVQEYVYVFAAPILVALGMNKLYTN